MRTQKLFAAIGLVAVLAVLGGAAYKVVAPGQQGGGTGTAAKSISELSINRHFSVRIENVGPFPGNIQGTPFVTTLPANMGFAIAQLSSSGGSNNGWTAVLVIRIDGVAVWKGAVPALGRETSVAKTYGPMTFRPPIIVRPGSFVELFLESTSTEGTDLTMSGYTLTLADFGL